MHLFGSKKKARLPKEPQIAAFFDIDRTLIAVNSGRKWIEYLWETGRISVPQTLRYISWLIKYYFSFVDLEALTARAALDYAGQDAANFAEEVYRWFHCEISKTICIQGREKIDEHRRKGHLIVLLTSGTQFSAHPLADLLQIEHVLCTRLEIEKGFLTGRHIPPACGGVGKVIHAERFANQFSVDLARSYFYTDSYSDLPMLKRVGQPRVVNPDPRLRRCAVAFGWEIETWTISAV